MLYTTGVALGSFFFLKFGSLNFSYISFLHCSTVCCLLVFTFFFQPFFGGICWTHTVGFFNVNFKSGHFSILQHTVISVFTGVLTLHVGLFQEPRDFRTFDTAVICFRKLLRTPFIAFTRFVIAVWISILTYTFTRFVSQICN